MPTDFLGSVGRIVWGNPFKSSPKTDQRTGQPILKDGQPIPVWAFGLAIPKAQFQANEWPNMSKEAATGFPQGVPQGFSWKYKDGDGVDRNGKPLSQREGYPGCYILTISTEAFAPPVFKLVGNQYQQMNEGVKTGDYVRVKISANVNVPPRGSTNTPSLYINPQGVEFIGYGTEIFAGPDAMTMFGGQAAQLPPGASATPMANPHAPQMPGAAVPAGTPFPPNGGYPQSGAPGVAASMPGVQPGGMPGQPMQPAMPPGYPPPAGAPMPGQAYPQQPMQPAYDFVGNATGGQVPGMPQPMPGYAPPAAAPMPGYPPQQSAPMPGQGYPQQPGYPMPGNR